MKKWVTVLSIITIGISSTVQTMDPEAKRKRLQEAQKSWYLIKETYIPKSKGEFITFTDKKGEPSGEPRVVEALSIREAEHHRNAQLMVASLNKLEPEEHIVAYADGTLHWASALSNGHIKVSEKSLHASVVGNRTCDESGECVLSPPFKKSILALELSNPSKDHPTLCLVALAEADDKQNIIRIWQYLPSSSAGRDQVVIHI